MYPYPILFSQDCPESLQKEGWESLFLVNAGDIPARVWQDNDSGMQDSWWGKGIGQTQTKILTPALLSTGYLS